MRLTYIEFDSPGETDPLSITAIIITGGSIIQPVVMTQQPEMTNLKIFKYEVYDHANERTTPAVNVETIQREIDFVELPNSDETLSAEDLGDLANEELVEIAPSVNRYNEETIEEFIMNNFRNNDASHITNRTYTSMSKLDIRNSAVPIECFNIKRTFDIDGFFGFLQVDKFRDCLNSPIRFNVVPSAVGPRTIKNIKSMLQIQRGLPVYSYTLWKIDLPLGSIEFMIMISPTRVLNLTFLDQVMKSAAKHSRNLPCDADGRHS